MHVETTQPNATWGIDPIDQRSLPLSSTYTYTATRAGVTSGVIAGVDWVTGNHQAGQPAVANMSLGGGQSLTLDQAVQSSIADGITYAVAAGNDGTVTMSGTSMATPHVVGAAALYLQGSRTASPQQVRDGLFNLTTKHIVTDARSANDNLLFVNF